MRRLGSSCAPTLVLMVVMGLAVLFPELAHSLAHRQAAATGSQLPTRMEAEQVARSALSGSQVADGHQHADLRARVPAKPILQHMVAPPLVIRLCRSVGDDRRLPPPIPGNSAPPRFEHDPPPPSRAPPLV